MKIRVALLNHVLTLSSETSINDLVRRDSQRAALGYDSGFSWKVTMTLIILRTLTPDA